MRPEEVLWDQIDSSEEFRRGIRASFLVETDNRVLCGNLRHCAASNAGRSAYYLGEGATTPTGKWF